MNKIVSFILSLLSLSLSSSLHTHNDFLLSFSPSASISFPQVSNYVAQRFGNHFHSICMNGLKKSLSVGIPLESKSYGSLLYWVLLYWFILISLSDIKKVAWIVNISFVTTVIQQCAGNVLLNRNNISLLKHNYKKLQLFVTHSYIYIVLHWGKLCTFELFPHKGNAISKRTA